MEVKVKIELEGMKKLEMLLKKNSELREQLYENITDIANVRFELNTQVKGVEFTSDSEDMAKPDVRADDQNLNEMMEHIIETVAEKMEKALSDPL